jgi:O-acetyl-ADP-ribose deacetylase (regulator of RNase III)
MLEKCLSVTTHPSMKTVAGDLIQLAKEGRFDVIIHGCNCFCTTGAGIAKGIKSAFPAAYEADRQTSPGDRSKLGTYSEAEIEQENGALVVINAYTQYNYRGPGLKADYEAIRSCMKLIRGKYSSKRIGLPKIGAGLAGGDWKIIAGIIAEELSGEDATLVEYEA